MRRCHLRPVPQFHQGTSNPLRVPGILYQNSLRCAVETYYGDLKQLELSLETNDDGHLLYGSTNALDVQRALLEIKILCLLQLRDFVKHTSSETFSE
jgi:hypothetical protein